jgi:hypothetical protein
MVGKETLYPYVLDLINRQKAEIERLKHRIKVNEWEVCDNFEFYTFLKAEAVKEFAERLKKEAFLPLGTFFTERVVIESEIDNLLKETVGDADA